MEKSLTFFRVFDLAFFAPGTILLTLGWLLFGDRSILSQQLDAALMPISILGFIALAFCVGLVIHSIVWLVKGTIERLPARSTGNSAKDWTPLPICLGEEAQVQLILYFWYLRATCWNVACALLVSTVAAWWYHDKLTTVAKEHLGALSIALLFATVALIYQGVGFHATYSKSCDLRK